MKVTGIEAGVAASPAIENCTTDYRYDPQLYIKSGSDDLQALRNEPVIRDFANIKPDTYELIKLTNPTLLMFVDLARKIMQDGGHE